MFSRIEAKLSVKLNDVIDIFDKTCKGSLVLEDNDAVKICLLVMLEHGFLGHQLSHNVFDDMLKLIEQLSNCWNIFPRRSYIWKYTYSQLRDALHKHMDIEGHPSYTSSCPQTTDGENSEGFGLGVDTTIYLVEIKVVSEQLKIEKDGISETKRKRGSSQPSNQDLTYDQLMAIVTKMEGIVATLTETVGTLESRLLALEGDARVSTLTHTVFSLQGTIHTLESRLLALEVCYL
uniref:Phospholipase-like protein n=1 Tax=Tanacetum cinerariifolium TaxID=118510 RepID=A0A699HUJ7_TANCI|nr:phospholipase-like protein [Tanacetum cinerariifolium]